MGLSIGPKQAGHFVTESGFTWFTLFMANTDLINNQ
jgi:hypothetical protein